MASIASGSPFRPSQHTISTSARPRLRISVSTESQKFGALAAVSQPHTQHVFAAVHVDADHHETPGRLTTVPSVLTFTTMASMYRIG